MPNTRSQRFSPTFSCGGVISLVLGSVFQSDPSWVNFCGEKYGSKIWFCFAYGYLIIPALFVEKLLFPH